MAFKFMCWYVILCSASGSNSTLLYGVFTSFWEGKVPLCLSKRRDEAALEIV